MTSEMPTIPIFAESYWFSKQNGTKLNNRSYSYLNAGYTWVEFNDVSALGCSLYWCQALHITNKDRYQYKEHPRTLALQLTSDHW